MAGDPELIRHSLAATPEAVRDALSQIVTALGGWGIGGREAGLIELLLAEALNNIVEHAYGGQGGRIRIRISRDAGLIRATLCDQGRPLPGDSLPPVREVRLDVSRQDLPEGGFGWHLIYSLARKLDYCRTQGDNHLTIWIDPERLG